MAEVKIEIEVDGTISGEERLELSEGIVKLLEAFGIKVESVKWR